MLRRCYAGYSTTLRRESTAALGYVWSCRQKVIKSARVMKGL
jgi:hypothetical protein